MDMDDIALGVGLGSFDVGADDHHHNDDDDHNNININNNSSINNT